MRMQIDATGSTIKLDGIIPRDEFNMLMAKLVTDGSWKPYDVTMNTTISSFTGQKLYPYNSPLTLALAGTYNIVLPKAKKPLKKVVKVVKKVAKKKK